MTPASEANLPADKVFEAFKFYEEAAEKTKGHAWAQTTWVLTLNAAILGFSLKLYADNASVRGFLVIEWIAALAGVVLCGYLWFVLGELGAHIRNYWTTANKLASSYEPLVPFVGESEANAARASDYHAGFPRFITRLKIPAVLFALAHLGWAVYVTLLSCP